MRTDFNASSDYDGQTLLLNYYLKIEEAKRELKIYEEADISLFDKEAEEINSGHTNTVRDLERQALSFQDNKTITTSIDPLGYDHMGNQAMIESKLSREKSKKPVTGEEIRQNAIKDIKESIDHIQRLFDHCQKKLGWDDETTSSFIKCELENPSIETLNTMDYVGVFHPRMIK